MTKAHWRLLCLKGTSGGRPVLLGCAPAKLLAAMSYADVLDERTGMGYQRRIAEQHSLDFRKYIRRAGSATIPLTFNLRPRSDGAWRVVERKAPLVELVLDESHGKALSQVDCQHRLGHVADLSLSLPFMIFVGLSRREEMEIFNVINSKAKGLSSSLLDFHESRLIADLGSERPELLIALRLNDDPASPWFKSLDLGGVVTSGMKRRASLRTVQKAVRRFLSATSILQDATVNDMATAVVQYWQAVRLVFADEWNQPRRHFITKGIGVYALMGLMADLCGDASARGLPLSMQTFSAFLSDYAGDFDWSSRGPLRGLGGESGAQEALSQLRLSRSRALRHTEVGA